MTLQANPNGLCKVCDRAFLRFRTMQAVCGPSCARKSVLATKKAEKDDTRQRRLAIKSRSEWLNEAQAAVNRYVRLRDQGLPCVSCGTAWTDSAQAGHYLSRGARPELRFELTNLASQCVKCNMHLHGNQAMYRVGLVSRIGVAAVEKLEGPNPAMHYSVDDLRVIKHKYRTLARELQVSQPA